MKYKMCMSLCYCLTACFCWSMQDYGEQLNFSTEIITRITQASVDNALDTVRTIESDYTQGARTPKFSSSAVSPAGSNYDVKQLGTEIGVRNLVSDQPIIIIDPIVREPLSSFHSVQNCKGQNQKPPCVVQQHSRSFWNFFTTCFRHRVC